ncbi:MAG: helix-turn-helix domain-containing protein [Betaproteobacteria bacterium]
MGLAGMRRRDAPDSGPIEITASQAELATMVGVTQQRLCELLGRLKARGLIGVGYRKIRVLR